MNVIKLKNKKKPGETGTIYLNVKHIISVEQLEKYTRITCVNAKTYLIEEEAYILIEEMPTNKENRPEFTVWESNNTSAGGFIM
jgi:hypothetical protein